MMNRRTKQNFLHGIFLFGPSYDNGSVVWFVNGEFRFISNCKARVRFDYDTGDIAYVRGCGYFINDLPQLMEDVEKVEIVEGDKNFRQYLPHVMSWRGKAPALIFVTTKSQK